MYQSLAKYGAYDDDCDLVLSEPLKVRDTAETHLNRLKFLTPHLHKDFAQRLYKKSLLDIEHSVNINPEIFNTLVDNIANELFSKLSCGVFTPLSIIKNEDLSLSSQHTIQAIFSAIRAQIPSFIAPSIVSSFHGNELFFIHLKHDFYKVNLINSQSLLPKNEDNHHLLDVISFTFRKAILASFLYFKEDDNCPNKMSPLKSYMKLHQARWNENLFQHLAYNDLVKADPLLNLIKELSYRLTLKLSVLSQISNSNFANRFFKKAIEKDLINAQKGDKKSEQALLGKLYLIRLSVPRTLKRL